MRADFHFRDGNDLASEKGGKKKRFEMFVKTSGKAKEEMETGRNDPSQKREVLTPLLLLVLQANVQRERGRKKMG